MPEKITEFVSYLSEQLDGDELPSDYYEDTAEIDTNDFSLSFEMSDTQFVVRNIDTHGNTGLGSKIVNAAKEYAEEMGLELMARQVEDGAEGFWGKMGFSDGGDGNFYLN